MRWKPYDIGHGHSISEPLRHGSDGTPKAAPSIGAIGTPYRSIGFGFTSCYSQISALDDRVAGGTPDNADHAEDAGRQLEWLH